MKVTLVLDGERYEVDVDPARGVVRVGDREWPVEIGALSDGGLSFEILGDKVEVHGDPSAPGAAVTINGEVHSLRVESRAGAVVTRAVAPVAGGRAPEPGVADAGPGHAVVPPMPGKVLEVRVRDGDAVAAGQVLLVIEAMKMRNEVVAPVAGTVAALRARSGGNVTAREVLLRILPA